MSLRSIITTTILLFLALACYLPVAFHRTAQDSAGNPKAVSNDTETETETQHYDKLKEHLRATINSVDEMTDHWYERSIKHLGTSGLGREYRLKVQAAMGHEEAMVARWRATLRRMTDGEYSYAQVVVESKKIDAESEAFLAELKAMDQGMQKIPGCHCGG